MKNQGAVRNSSSPPCPWCNPPHMGHKSAGHAEVIKFTLYVRYLCDTRLTMQRRPQGHDRMKTANKVNRLGFLEDSWPCVLVGPKNVLFDITVHVKHLVSNAGNCVRLGSWDFLWEAGSLEGCCSGGGHLEGRDSCFASSVKAND